MKKKKALKILPLGGVDEIGKNMTVIEYDNDILIVDCGSAFPDEEMLGIDLVIAIGTKAVRIADGAAMSGGRVLHFETKEDVAIQSYLQSGTAMLVKASHAMRFETLVAQLKEFYD